MTMYDMESIHQWAAVYGQKYPDRAWLLHDSDFWVRNPWYRGEPQPHPEERP